MNRLIALNARFFHRSMSGVVRYAHEISTRLVPPPRTIMPVWRAGQVSGHFWEQCILPLRLHGNEVLWSPANSGPWLLSKQAVTLHDASVFDHPEWFSRAFASWTRLAWRILAKRARAIITVSEFSRQRLIARLRLPSHKIHMIPNGVAEPFKPQSKAEAARIAIKYGLEKPYFLFVGTLEPRKNLARLLEAFGDMNTSAVLLAIAGGRGRVFPNSGPASREIGGSRYLGHVPDRDLPALYSGAVALVAPSLYEGSGLTVLEAMACGTPVIASNSTALSEVCGEAALLANSRETQALTAAMQNILANSGLADTLRERGLARAAEFSWDATASNTQAVLQAIA